MPKTIPEQNDALVLEAFDTLFNTLDYRAAERFWSPKYIQHSAHKAPGRDGLFALIRSAPQTLRYENQLIVAEGDYVMSHGHFSGIGRSAAWVVLHAHECLGHSAPPQSQGRIACSRRPEHGCCRVAWHGAGERRRPGARLDGSGSGIYLETAAERRTYPGAGRWRGTVVMNTSAENRAGRQ